MVQINHVLNTFVFLFVVALSAQVHAIQLFCSDLFQSRVEATGNINSSDDRVLLGVQRGDTPYMISLRRAAMLRKYFTNSGADGESSRYGQRINDAYARLTSNNGSSRSHPEPPPRSSTRTEANRGRAQTPFEHDAAIELQLEPMMREQRRQENVYLITSDRANQQYNVTNAILFMVRHAEANHVPANQIGNYLLLALPDLLRSPFLEGHIYEFADRVAQYVPYTDFITKANVQNIFWRLSVRVQEEVGARRMTNGQAIPILFKLQILSGNHSENVDILRAAIVDLQRMRPELSNFAITTMAFAASARRFGENEHTRAVFHATLEIYEAFPAEKQIEVFSAILQPPQPGQAEIDPQARRIVQGRLRELQPRGGLFDFRLFTRR